VMQGRRERWKERGEKGGERKKEKESGEDR
jgi:hypothetical protein